MIYNQPFFFERQDTTGGVCIMIMDQSLPRLMFYLVIIFCPVSAVAENNEPLIRHVFPSLDGNIVAERVLEGISQPVAIEFLPDGNALVLQRDRGLITLADFETGEKVDVEGLPRLVVFSDADVDDDCAGRDPLRVNDARLADRRDQ